MFGDESAVSARAQVREAGVAGSHRAGGGGGAHASRQAAFLAQARWRPWGGEGDPVRMDLEGRADIFLVDWMWGGARGKRSRGRPPGLGVRRWKGALSAEWEGRWRLPGGPFGASCM